MVRLEALREVYDRGDCGAFSLVRAEGATKEEALIKLIDKMGLYLNADEIKERREEGEVITFEQLIKEIEADNGDGCDFVIYIKDAAADKYYLREFTIEE